jgi:hypothetical protein
MTRQIDDSRIPLETAASEISTNLSRETSLAQIKGLVENTDVADEAQDFGVHHSIQMKRPRNH